MSRNPTQAELLNRAIESALGDLYMGMPGKVVRYDAGKQEADVQPLIKVSYTDEAGERKLEALPVVPSVPVVFQGGGGFVVQFPIDVGDTVWLMFTAVSIDKWLKVGGGPIDPESDSRHALSDAVAIPGLRSFKDKRQQSPSGHILIGKDGDPSEPAALGQTLKEFLDALVLVYDAHTHLSSTPGNATGPPVPLSQTPPNPPLLADVRSGTVKVTK